MGRVGPAEAVQGVFEDPGVGFVDPDLVGEGPVVEVLQQPVALEMAEEGRRRSEAHVADDPEADSPLRQGGQRVGHTVEQHQLGALALVGEGLQDPGAEPGGGG
jgi:hypothetical protein